MDLIKAKEDLKLLQAKMAAFDHALGLLSYDGATTAPKATASNRAQTMGILTEEYYKLQTGDETIALLEFLEANANQLTQAEKRQVQMLLRDLKEMRLIPMQEYVEYEKLIVEAEDVWHDAKATSNFAIFEPYLTKIFETTRRFASYLAPDMHPYDYWLNKFEEGLNMQVCDEFFDKVRSRLVPLIAKVASKPTIDNSFLLGDYSDDAQEEFSYYLMNLIGLDLEHVGLATTEHPFTTSLGSHFDERITTRYLHNDFTSSMYSVIHEGGHALYDTGSRDEFAFTVLDCGVSMGIHESQSRFYENILGRSYEFVSHIFPKIQQLFPNMCNYSAKDFWQAINKVQPSLIRTEADEVTYCLHVMIRYELEKRVMSNELCVHDFPKEWNRLYKQYLGVDVPNDKVGVLQDSHWSGGAIGYFPSYALGSAYGVQFLRKMSKEVDVKSCLLKGDFAPINAWNKANIWQYGRLYTPKQLLENVLGEPFNADYYLDYLEQKVNQVYNLD